MKKILFIISLFLISISAFSQSNNNPNLSNTDEEEESMWVCQSFTVTVHLGIVDIKTTVSVCCTIYTTPCLPMASGRQTNNILKGMSEAKIVNSSIYQDINGNQYRIKNGTYPLDPNGNLLEVQLEQIN